MKQLDCGGAGRWIYGSCALALSAALCLVLAQPRAFGSAAQGRQGGTAEVVLVGADIDSLDPALTYSVAASYLVDATCALLMRHERASHGASSSLQPEVASRPPRSSRDRRTFTFSSGETFVSATEAPFAPTPSRGRSTAPSLAG